MTPSTAISNGPDNDAYADAMRQYRSQKRVVEEESGVLRAIVKRAKESGINTRSLIAACKAAKHDQDDVIADLRDQMRCMTILRLGVTPDALFTGWQTDIGDSARTADDSWAAEDAGYAAGRHGKPIDDCPYPAGSPLAAAYQTMWHKGQASIARELGENAKPADASRARPTRAADVATLPAPVRATKGSTATPVKRGRGRPPKNGYAHAAAAP